MIVVLFMWIGFGILYVWLRMWMMCFGKYIMYYSVCCWLWCGLCSLLMIIIGDLVELMLLEVWFIVWWGVYICKVGWIWWVLNEYKLWLLWVVEIVELNDELIDVSGV